MPLQSVLLWSKHIEFQKPKFLKLILMFMYAKLNLYTDMVQLDVHMSKIYTKTRYFVLEIISYFAAYVCMYFFLPKRL